jgi:hypothetical protein
VNNQLIVGTSDMEAWNQTRYMAIDARAIEFYGAPADVTAPDPGALRIANLIGLSDDRVVGLLIKRHLFLRSTIVD